MEGLFSLLHLAGPFRALGSILFHVSDLWIEQWMLADIQVYGVKLKCPVVSCHTGLSSAGQFLKMSRTSARMTSHVHLRQFWPNCHCTPSKSSSQNGSVSLCGTGENVRHPNQPMSLHRFQRHGGGYPPLKNLSGHCQVLICEAGLAPLLGIGWWHLLWLRSVRHIVEFRNVPFEAKCVL